MKTLVQGCESAQQIEILLKLTGISSDNIKNALRAYLVEGFPASRCYARYEVTQQHFSRALINLNHKAELLIQLVKLKEQHSEQMDAKVKAAFDAYMSHPFFKEGKEKS
ncbi:PapB/FocB family fimbrial expression transcriptional regulator [Shewanella xiamenensis]|uniref:PapB/FocB family fimbrial expression transcriptional regulator n=1 Tax=Shewanella xiamenensis TaxID=332186 RepID=UPI002E7B4259|nr:PapB/FocB family fimbrial expression transcriptional regulator [Shewanella xiamenensis]MEE1981369.1 PapB/FocB family fimbrial expression transcriptional regulator [Shewanella xiamenensis]